MGAAGSGRWAGVWRGVWGGVAGRAGRAGPDASKGPISSIQFPVLNP